MKDMSITYHASSPDEVALVQWTEKVGMALLFRDIKSIKLRNPLGQMMHFEILDIFPFSSETKRMGIIVKDLNTKEIVFYLKGADTVMSSIITYSDWLQEQCDNMARSGLRTLVVAKKLLDEEQYTAFQELYNQAKCNMNDRASRIRTVLATLEKDMELLCLTGKFLFIFFGIFNNVFFCRRRRSSSRRRGHYAKGPSRCRHQALDVDGRQARDGHLHCQVLAAGQEDAGVLRLSAGGQSS